MNHNPCMLSRNTLVRFDDVKSAIDKRIPPRGYRWLDLISPLLTEMVGSAHLTAVGALTSAMCFEAKQVALVGAPTQI